MIQHTDNRIEVNEEKKYSKWTECLLKTTTQENFSAIKRKTVCWKNIMCA